MRVTLTVLTSLAVLVGVAIGVCSSGSAEVPRRAASEAAQGRLPGVEVRARPIPFGPKRRRQMRAYARRHYGIDSIRLRPRVIVEHFTATSSYRSAYATFAANRPDAELGELPGVCSHYLIARDGGIARLVSPRVMCRHTVGLNHRAIGIEHVGTSDGQVLGNRVQRRASLRLTHALQGRFDIPTRDVIGHAESLTSRFHRERVRSLRRQTHSDFARPAMRRYRELLGRLAR